MKTTKIKQLLLFTITAISLALVICCISACQKDWEMEPEHHLEDVFEEIVTRTSGTTIEYDATRLGWPYHTNMRIAGFNNEGQILGHSGIYFYIWHFGVLPNPNGAGNALKSCRQVNSPIGGDCDTSEHPRWEPNTTHHGFDEFDFSAVPAGYLSHSNVIYQVIGVTGYFWSSTENTATMAFPRAIRSHFGHVHRDVNWGYKRNGFSIRCIKVVDD